MRFLDALLGSGEGDAERALSADSYTALMQSWPAGSRERMDSSFQSYATLGFASNAAVFAVMVVRSQLFTQASFRLQALRDEHLFGTPALQKLEAPWPGGTTAELLARMLQDVDLAGNSFVRDCGDRLERFRPDRVQIASVVREDRAREVVGYVYDREGRGNWTDAEVYDVAEVAHWSPVPDPLAEWRGMSWLTPVVREIDSDAAMTVHKQKFFDNAATPNMVIKYKTKLSSEVAETVAARVRARHGGASNAWQTMILDEGADVTFVGNDFGQMTFTAMQAAGETRIAAAAGVPPIVAGLKEGLEAGTYSNYGMAMRRFGEGTMAHLWQSACAALAKLVEVPTGCRLWYDKSGIAALQESLKDRADALQVQAAALSTLVMAGFTPDSAINAVNAGDIALLVHSGKTSVQLYPSDATAPTPEMTGPPNG